MDRALIESDNNLVTTAVRGDVDAFEQLVGRHQGAARNLAALLVDSTLCPRLVFSDGGSGGSESPRPLSLPV